MKKINRKVSRNLLIGAAIFLFAVTAFINYCGTDSDMLFLRNNFLFFGNNHYKFNVYYTEKRIYQGFGEKKTPTVNIKYAFRNNEGNKSLSYEIKEPNTSIVVLGNNLLINLTGEYYYSLYMEVIKNGNKVFSETLNTDGTINYSDY